MLHSWILQKKKIDISSPFLSKGLLPTENLSFKIVGTIYLPWIKNIYFDISEAVWKNESKEFLDFLYVVSIF